MLVLSRRPGEEICVGDITITVLGVHGHRVRLGLTAPPEVTIKRSELLQEQWNRDRATETLHTRLFRFEKGGK